MIDDDDDETSKDKEIDKLMALISLSFKKIYKPTNNNLRTSSNTSRANQDNSPRINRNVGYERQRSGNVAGARETIDQNDEDADIAKERELFASLIKKLKCEIDESKNRNKFLETSNKVLIDKLKSEIEDFKNKNKSLELSNNQFKKANNKLSEENDLLYADFKQSQAELKRRDSIEKAKQANPRLYDIGCYNDNLALILSPESDEVIRLEKESRSKLSDLIRPFDYAKLNSLYDLFVPQRENLSE
nr:hypothetical protein [Tanacetum cinerariifolium]